MCLVFTTHLGCFLLKIELKDPLYTKNINAASDVIAELAGVSIQITGGSNGNGRIGVRSCGETKGQNINRR